MALKANIVWAEAFTSLPSVHADYLLNIEAICENAGSNNEAMITTGEFSCFPKANDNIWRLKIHRTLEGLIMRLRRDWKFMARQWASRQGRKRGRTASAGTVLQSGSLWELSRVWNSIMKLLISFSSSVNEASTANRVIGSVGSSWKTSLKFQ